MVNTAKLRGVMAEQGKSIAQTAREIGMKPQTLRIRMRTGRFWTDEIDALVKALGINNPAEIFLAKRRA